MKLFKTIFFFLLILVNIPAVFSNNSNPVFKLLFEKANTAYQEKDYSKALDLYDSLEKSGFIHPALFFNKGNVYYKLNNFPKAILYFEKAKKYEANNPEIDHNLKLANLQIIDKIEPVPQLKINTVILNFIHLFRSDTWAIINIASIWLSLLLLVISFFFKKIKNFLWFSSLMFFIVFTITMLSARASYLEENNDAYGIIMSQVIELKSAPDPGSSSLFILHEGTKAKILESVNNWSKIKLEDGKTGWLLNTSFEKI